MSSKILYIVYFIAERPELLLGDLCKFVNLLLTLFVLLILYFGLSTE